MSTTLQETLDLIANGNYEAGLRMLDRLVDAPDENLEALGHRGWFFFKTSQYNLALSDYLKLLSLIGPNAEIELLIAECHIELFEKPKAAEIIGRVIQSDPSNKQALYLLMKINNASLDRETFLNSFGGPIPNVMTAVINSTHAYFPAPINPTIGLLLYSLLRNLLPDIVIEIGSYIGQSGIYMGQALKDNGKGLLHCFDLFDQQLPDYLAHRKQQHIVFTEHIRMAGLENVVSSHAGDSSKEITETHLAIKNNERVFIFIDGDHTLKGVVKDYNSILPLLNDNAIIAFHDTDYKNTPWAGPAILASRLLDSQKYNALMLPIADKTGLALFQPKRSEEVLAVRPTIRELIMHKLYYLLSK